MVTFSKLFPFTGQYMFKPICKFILNPCLRLKVKVTAERENGHRKDIGHLVQSGGEILVLSTGSSKMSINICSGNVLGYKQATYQP